MAIPAGGVVGVVVAVVVILMRRPADVVGALCLLLRHLSFGHSFLESEIDVPEDRLLWSGLIDKHA